MSDEDYITIQVRFPRAVLERLRQAMTVRFMAGSEGHGVIEAFLGRVLEDVADGGGSHEFKSGSITTTVLHGATVTMLGAGLARTPDGLTIVAMYRGTDSNVWAHGRRRYELHELEFWPWAVPMLLDIVLRAPTTPVT